MKKLSVPMTFAGGILIFALLTPAAGFSDPRVEEAKKEGAMVLYSGMTVADAKALLGAFEKKYPFIKTTHHRVSGARLISRIQTEHRAGRYLWDVFMQAGFDGYALLEEGYFTRYESPERVHFSDGHKDPEGYWTTAYVTPMTASYNKRLVSKGEVPKDYLDFLEPKWTAKLGVDPREVEWYANIKKVWGPDKARRFVTGLARSRIALREGRALLTELLGAGEFAILVNNYLQNLVEAQEKGSPIELLALDPVIAGAGPIAIYRLAPHPNAARLFVDFVLSKEGQEIIVHYGRSSARSDVRGNPIEKVKGVKIIPSDIKLGKFYRETLKEFQELLGVIKK